MKLNKDRLWWLKQFSDRGWSIGRPNYAGMKKWRGHTEALLKMGFIEQDHTLYRVTEAGHAALSIEKEGE